MAREICLKIRELREKTGMTQGKFAEQFHIPVRTLQKWENEERQPPEYVVYMMEKILQLEEK